MTYRPRTPAFRKTGRRVRLFDNVARFVITAGGLAVLAAMFGIMIFLVATALPLFEGAHVTAVGPVGSISDVGELAAVRVVNDTHRAILLNTNGRFRDIDLDSGEAHTDITLGGGEELTAVAFEPGRWRATFGTASGKILTYELDEKWHSVAPDAQLPQPMSGHIRRLSDDAERELVQQAMHLPSKLSPLSYLEKGPGGTLLWEPTASAQASFQLEQGQGPIVRLDSSGTGSRSRFLAAIRADSTGIFATVRSTVRLSGSGATDDLRAYPFHLPPDRDVPDHIFVLANGGSVILIWRDGTFARLDSRHPRDGLPVVEQGRLVAQGRMLSAASMAFGGLTLVVGDDAGMMSTYLVVDDLHANSTDGRRIEKTWTQRLAGGAVQRLVAGDRDRTMTAVCADGTISLYHLTSRKKLLTRPGAPAHAFAVTSPSTSFLLALEKDGTFQSWGVDPGYADVGMRSLFGKVHYEGYNEPKYVYQSTGSAQSQPKYSLIPLIFGTVKATVFAMLFAVPIAIAAAIYSSEFMHRKLHRGMKPSIELMASLPSVVIGFVAAMVVAPLVRSWLPALMVGLLVVPVCAAFAGTLWQSIPPRYARRFGSRTQLALVTIVIVGSAVLSWLVGPTVENALFAPSRGARLIAAGAYELIPEGQLPADLHSPDDLSEARLAALRTNGVFFVGNKAVRPVKSDIPLPPPDASIKRWLDGLYGQPFPGWLVAMMFPAACIVPFVHGRFVARRWNNWLNTMPARTAAVIEIGRFAAMVMSIVVVAAALAWLLSAIGLDPRDSIFGDFTQQNTLVVGIVMGFAVIPIIYTISEDALASVPNSLRTASLGTGATRWQTAVRVVLPVAGSGIFSACMIGLGRAVGETMIVLMATGNTPEMKWNIFSGFRSLAANIAVELPEAPRGDTHYRVLFLCGLLLFAMTLLINTTAEMVRQHFRRRNAAL